jgi:glycosyltransferase involved in cell wall biosynthesis
MSYGKAVIGSDIPENMELLSESGVPVPVGDTNALAHAILDLVRDPMQATALGRLSREIVESDYHWDDIAKKTVTLYENEKRMPVAVLALR